jgi:hypothetical protein
LILLNLAGGSCVEDIERLEADRGFAMLLRNLELYGLRGKEKREALARFRSAVDRALPSPSSVLRYLEAFHDPAQAAVQGTAFIPSPSSSLKGIYATNAAVVAFQQKHHPQTEATLDVDATVIETQKTSALYSYQGPTAYQPLQVFWAEQEILLHSEFRDGNVPAGHEILRVLKESLKFLPAEVGKVSFRSDTAAYQWDVLKFCARGTKTGVGVIEFVVGVDVTKEFKKAVDQDLGSAWTPLLKDGKPTGQEWAEVVYVPAKLAEMGKDVVVRFVAIRELLEEQTALPGLEPAPKALPFQTYEVETKTGVKRYKLHGIVTNRLTMPGEELIQWYRNRCGKSEEAHKILKEDLAGGVLPSGKFGANAAWWALVVLTFNLEAVMKRLVLQESWIPKRLKAVRFHLIGVAGRLVTHGRKLILKVAEEVHQWFVRLRTRIQGLVEASP